MSNLQRMVKQRQGDEARVNLVKSTAALNVQVSVPQSPETVARHPCVSQFLSLQISSKWHLSLVCFEKRWCLSVMLVWLGHVGDSSARSRCSLRQREGFATRGAHDMGRDSCGSKLVWQVVWSWLSSGLTLVSSLGIQQKRLTGSTGVNGHVRRP